MSMMTDARLIGWPIWVSVGLHAAGLATAGTVVSAAHHEAARVLVPVEVVRVEPPPPPPAPPQLRMPRPVAKPTPVAPVAPTQNQTLMDDPTPRFAPTPQTSTASPYRRYMASAEAPAGLAVPGPAGAGGLLLPSPTIPGAPNGGSRGGTSVARGSGDGVTSFARPLGGYQTTPHYPEAARREGVEGTVTLRFEVLASGKVGTVQVQSSAGRADMDRAAVEAVRTWLFEPARRGKEAVAVWVTLPVRFELNTR
jgi:protein TonB